MPPLGNRRNQQQNQRPQSPFGRFARGPVLYVIVLLVLAYILLTTLAGAKTIKELTLTDYLQRIDSGQATPMDLDLMESIQGNITGNCLCLLGDSMAMPVSAMLKRFRPEFEEHMAARQQAAGRVYGGTIEAEPDLVGAAAGATPVETPQEAPTQDRQAPGNDGSV